MISKDMYKILKKVPRSPKRITFKELSDKKIVDHSFLWDLLEEAMNCRYLVYASRNPTPNLLICSFYLTEEGQIAIEEFKNQADSNIKATWALIIAGLSFIASVVAIVVSCVQ